MKKPETWFATKDGYIFSYKKRGFTNNLRKIAGQKTGTLSPDGYLKTQVDLYPYKASIHRLVWEYFNGKIPKHLQINHINGIKTDNRLENLELLTPKENIRHAFRTGLNKGKKGSEHNYSKLTEKKVIKIRKLYASGNYTQEELAQEFKIDQTQISNIVKRKQWIHI